MSRGKRTNTALRCPECDHSQDNYIIRLLRESIKGFSAKKYCSSCRKHTAHTAKEVKGGY